jgi:deoxyribodipyrimidine photolyase
VLVSHLDLGSALRIQSACWTEQVSIFVGVSPQLWERQALTPNHRIDCQNDLSASLTKSNENQKLFVLREAPQTLLPKLFRAWKISHLVFEKDTDAYARERDEEVRKLAKEAGVEVISKSGRTLWDSDELVKANGGKPIMSISQVQAVRSVH